LLDSGLAERLQATTRVDNAARAILERLAFTCEGTLRSYLPQREGRADAVLYARVRSD